MLKRLYELKEVEGQNGEGSETVCMKSRSVKTAYGKQRTMRTRDCKISRLLNAALFQENNRVRS